MVEQLVRFFTYTHRGTDILLLLNEARVAVLAQNPLYFLIYSNSKMTKINSFENDISIDSYNVNAL